MQLTWEKLIIYVQNIPRLHVRSKGVYIATQLNSTQLTQLNSVQPSQSSFCLWRHDLQTESTGSLRSLIGDSCSRCERVDNSTSSWVELWRYKHPLTSMATVSGEANNISLAVEVTDKHAGTTCNNHKHATDVNLNLTTQLRSPRTLSKWHAAARISVDELRQSRALFRRRKPDIRSVGSRRRMRAVWRHWRRRCCRQVPLLSDVCRESSCRRRRDGHLREEQPSQTTMKSALDSPSFRCPAARPSPPAAAEAAAAVRVGPRSEGRCTIDCAIEARLAGSCGRHDRRPVPHQRHDVVPPAAPRGPCLQHVVGTYDRWMPTSCLLHRSQSLVPSTPTTSMSAVETLSSLRHEMSRVGRKASGLMSRDHRLRWCRAPDLCLHHHINTCYLHEITQVGLRSSGSIDTPVWGSYPRHHNFLDLMIIFIHHNLYTRITSVYKVWSN